MRNVLRSAENQQQNANDGAVHHQDTTENRGDFKYDEVLRWIYALGGPQICASFPNWTLFNFMITWLCQLASAATSCSREQII